MASAFGTALVIINKGDKGKWDRVSFEWGALPDYFSSCWSSGRSFSASERRAPPIFVLLAGIVVVVVVVHLQPVGLLRQLLVGGDVLGRPGSSGPHLRLVQLAHVQRRLAPSREKRR